MDDGRTVIDAQQVSWRVQQPWLETVQIQHEFGPCKYTRQDNLTPDLYFESRFQVY